MSLDIRERERRNDGGSTAFSNEFLEVVQTIHPEIDSRDELLNAAFRMTAIAELATPDEQDEMGPDQGYPIPPMALASFYAQLTAVARADLEGRWWEGNRSE